MGGLSEVIRDIVLSIILVFMLSIFWYPSCTSSPFSTPSFIFIFLNLIFIGYMHQVPRYSYSGTCAGLFTCFPLFFFVSFFSFTVSNFNIFFSAAFTFLIVFDGQYNEQHPNVWFATMRVLHILMVCKTLRHLSSSAFSLLFLLLCCSPNINIRVSLL